MVPVHEVPIVRNMIMMGGGGDSGKKSWKTGMFQHTHGPSQHLRSPVDISRPIKDHGQLKCGPSVEGMVRHKHGKHIGVLVGRDESVIVGF